MTYNRKGMNGILETEVIKMKNVFVLAHPLIQHKMTLMRSKDTQTKDFRELMGEVAMLMTYEVTRDLPLEETTIETPLAKTKSNILAGKSLCLVPILRAGLGMVEGVQNLIPSAKVGHIGLYREHDTLQIVEYYSKFPEDIAQRDVIILEPMVATGGSLIAAINILKQKGVNRIKVLSIVAATEGMTMLANMFPDVQFYTTAIDKEMNEASYIVPGLGDAGDRLFGTK